MERLSLFLLALVLSGCAVLDGFGQQTSPPLPARVEQASLSKVGDVYRLSAGIESLGRTYVLVSGKDLRVPPSVCGSPQFADQKFQLLRATCFFERVETFADLYATGSDITVRVLTYQTSTPLQPLELCYPANICEPP